MDYEVDDRCNTQEVYRMVGLSLRNIGDTMNEDSQHRLPACHVWPSFLHLWYSQTSLESCMRKIFNLAVFCTMAVSRDPVLSQKSTDSDHKREHRSPGRY